MIIENTTFFILLLEEIESFFITSIIKDMFTDKNIQHAFYLRLFWKMKDKSLIFINWQTEPSVILLRQSFMYIHMLIKAHD